MRPTSPRRTSRRLLILVCAGALAAPLLGWTVHMLALSSLTIAPEDVGSGSSASGTVVLDAFAKSASVNLSSSNTGLATVSSPLLISGSDRGSFSVRTARGVTGCATVTARLGVTSARSARVAVHPPSTPSASPVKLRFADSSIVSGQTGEGRIFLPTASTTTTVQLSSSDPAAASVPASIQVPVTFTESGAFGSATFPITTTTSGVLRCPVITATLNGATSRVLLKIFPVGG